MGSRTWLGGEIRAGETGRAGCGDVKRAGRWPALCTSGQWSASELSISKYVLGSHCPGEGEILSRLFQMSFAKGFFDRLQQLYDSLLAPFIQV
jgi:hypothetical protein